MATYAQINENDIVINVIVAEEEFINSLPDASMFIQTSRNTYGGVHILGKTPLRKNYAAIGYLYDRNKDAFIPPKIFDSYVFNEQTCQWDPPIPCPNKDGYMYKWDENTVSWIEELIPPDESA